MGGSLLRRLGFDKPRAPQQRVRHKVWRKQLAGSTRKLEFGAVKARQRSESDMEMLDGTEVVRVIDAAVAGHEAEAAADAEAGARVQRLPGFEAEAAAAAGPAGQVVAVACATLWGWVASTGVGTEGAGTGAEAGAEPKGGGGCEGGGST